MPSVALADIACSLRTAKPHRLRAISRRVSPISPAVRSRFSRSYTLGVGLDSWHRVRARRYRLARQREYSRCCIAGGESYERSTRCMGAVPLGVSAVAQSLTTVCGEGWGARRSMCYLHPLHTSVAGLANVARDPLTAIGAAATSCHTGRGIEK